MYHQQIFCIMKICHLEDQLFKLEKEVIVTRILEVLQIWFLSILKIYQLRLPFVSAFEDSFFKLKVVELERQMVLTYIRDYHAILYQMRWIYLEKHLSHQLQVFLQTQFVFYELLLVIGQYVSILEQNLIGKV